MRYDQSSRVVNFVAGFVLGAAVGVLVALLTAPESGRRTRKRLVHAASDARKFAGQRLEDWSDDVRAAVTSGRRRLTFSK